MFLPNKQEIMQDAPETAWTASVPRDQKARLLRQRDDKPAQAQA